MVWKPCKTTDGHDKEVDTVQIVMIIENLVFGTTRIHKFSFVCFLQCRFNICIKDWDRTGTTSSGGAIILDIHCCCRKHDLKRRKRGSPMVRDGPSHQQSTIGMCSVPEYGAWSVEHGALELSTMVEVTQAEHGQWMERPRDDPCTQLIDKSSLGL